MNEEYWLRLWAVVILGVIAITVSSLVSCQASKYQLRKAIEAGASPMEAACAFDHGMVTDGSLCAIELTKKK